MNTVAVIPARGGSKRLDRKNIQLLFGKPLLQWSIEACLQSQAIDTVFVSSDDEKILTIAEQNGAGIIERPADLADDVTPKIEVIRHAYRWIKSQRQAEPEIIASVQANSPELKASDLDRAIEMLRNLDCWEVFSVDERDLMNGAIRILRSDCLFNSFLSAHMAVIRTDYVDVHEKSDLERIVDRYADSGSFIAAKQSL